MRLTDPIAACDRLIGVLERTIPLSRPPGRDPSDDAIRIPILRFAIAQLRMRVRPALQPDWIAIDPVHVALFGATNTGKSTIVNLLLGRAAAGMGVRARLSQHPEAFYPAAVSDRWLEGSPTRFQGYRRYRDVHPPRQSDDELQRTGYRPALAVLELNRLPSPRLATTVLSHGILWDAPDFSTEQAGSYLDTVLDLLSLADLVVMSVTDESYADHRGIALLKMVGESSVPMVVVANKLSENPTLLEDISRTLGTAGQTAAPVLRLPETPGTSTADRLDQLLRSDDARALREKVRSVVELGPALKRQSLAGAVAFLERHLNGFLSPMAEELKSYSQWETLVRRLTRDVIVAPYQRDYLDGVRYQELNRTLLHLMELLQVPGIGPLLDLTGRVVRIPWRLAGRGVARLLGGPSTATKRQPEKGLLMEAIPSWVSAIKAEVQVLARAEPCSVWSEIVAAFDQERFRADLTGRFERAFEAYQTRMESEVKRRAEALYERLRQSPGRLTTLRGANLMISATSVAVAVKTAGLDWSDAVLGPAVAGVWQNLLEWGLGRYLETLREELKAIQLEEVSRVIDVALEQPVRDLFHGAFQPADLEAALEDFAVVKAEASRIVEGVR